MIRRVLATVIAATVVGLAAVAIYFALNEDSSSAPELRQDFVGTYQSEVIPSAGCCGRVVSLTLRQDTSAVLATDFRNNESPVLQEGNWLGEDAQVVAITLTSGGGRSFTNPITVRFARDGNVLRTMGSTEMFGSSGLSLTKQ